jgi:hypothetical protein
MGVRDGFHLERLAITTRFTTRVGSGEIISIHREFCRRDNRRF